MSGTGVVSSARKSPWRFLPEIHASRLSVSGSLRPKLGLLILFILLVLSIALVVIPLVTSPRAQVLELKLRNPSHFLIGEYLRSTWRSRPNLIFSPVGFSASLGWLQTLVEPSLQAELQSYLDPPHIRKKNLNNFSDPMFVMNLTLEAKNLTELPNKLLVSAINHGIQLNSSNKLRSHELSFINKNLLKSGVFPIANKDFHITAKKSKQVTMVVLKSKFRRLQMDTLQVIEVSLDVGVRLQLLLPHKVNSIGSILENMEDILSISTSQKWEEQSGTVLLPILELDAEYEAEHVMEDLGLKQIFQSGQILKGESDFTIVRVIHSVKIRFLKGESNIDVEKDAIICDRGFLFNLYAPHLNTPMVSGIYTQPS